MRPSPQGAKDPQRLPLFEAGTVLDGTYRIVRLLGAGGMGEVYLAAHERLPGHFAIKALQPELAHNVEALSRFRREAEVMAGLRHPNIVQVIDFNIAPSGAPYLVMELLEGPDLSMLLRRNHRFSPAEVVAVIRQVASALDTAHSSGVVHRDLKPENIVLIPATGQAPVVKVIDFGISLTSTHERITQQSRVLGTPEFMAPEQAQGRRDEIDARTDQFALAVLAFTLLAGDTPYQGENSLSVLYTIVHGEPESLAGRVPWPIDDVEAVLRKGMARRREDRYRTVLDFAEALEVALVRSGAVAHATPPPRPLTPAPALITPPPAPAFTRADTIRMRRVPRGMLALAVLALVGSGVGAVRVAGPEAFARGISAASDVATRGFAAVGAWLGRPEPIPVPQISEQQHHH